MEKRIVRFAPTDDRREKTVDDIAHLLKMLYDEDNLSWSSIDNLLTNVNNNTWTLSRQFGIHVARVVALQRRLCFEGYVPFYSVREFIWQRMSEEANDGRAALSTLQNGEQDRPENETAGFSMHTLRPDGPRHKSYRV